jgi:hypothetical protein
MDEFKIGIYLSIAFTLKTIKPTTLSVEHNLYFSGIKPCTRFGFQ